MRYYFDILDGDHWTRDDAGIECRDDREARRQAVLALMEMASDLIPYNGANMELAVRVRHGENMAITVHLNFATEAGPGLQDSRAVHS